ncbi:hypothetical protein NHX12_025163, partial [Muraenolepis orangiensis]
MKQLYNVPFDRNSDRVKETRHQYVQDNRSPTMSDLELICGIVIPVIFLGFIPCMIRCLKRKPRPDPGGESREHDRRPSVYIVPMLEEGRGEAGLRVIQLQDLYPYTLEDHNPPPFYWIRLDPGGESREHDRRNSVYIVPMLEEGRGEAGPEVIELQLYPYTLEDNNPPPFYWDPRGESREHDRRPSVYIVPMLEEGRGEAGLRVIQLQDLYPYTLEDNNPSPSYW